MAGDSRAAAEQVLEVVVRVFAAHGHRPTGRIADQLFQELTGVDADALPRLVFGRGKLKIVRARRPRDPLAALFGCS